MALSTDQYGYLIDPLVPITDATGTTIKDGFLRVYIAGSSTPVITYRNYDGAVNEQTIELDNSGRCKYPVIVSKSLAYKVVVYDAQHSQETPIITVDKMFAIGASVTAGTGSTIVQGLDNVEGESDGFVKAEVVGTTATVRLDATNVSHTLNSDAAVSYAANAGYIVPALSNDPDDPGDPQNLPLAWIWGNRLNAVHTKTEISDFADENDGFLVDSNAGPKFMKWKTLANKVLGFIKSLSTTITAFRTGDVIPVDGPSGTAKMSKDDLLRMTAENAVNSGVAASQADMEDYVVQKKHYSGADTWDVNGRYLNVNGGESEFIAGTSATDFIEIKKNSVISGYGYGVNAALSLYYFYDEDKQPISGYHPATGYHSFVAEIPDNAVYVRFSHWKNVGDTYYDIQWNIEENTGIEIAKAKDEIYGRLNDVLSYDIDLINLFTKGSKYLTIGGNESSYFPGWSCTDFIGINPFTQVSGKGMPFSNGNISLVFFYDEDKQPISGYHPSGDDYVTFNLTAPINAKYVRLSKKNNDSNITAKMSWSMESYVNSMISDIGTPRFFYLHTSSGISDGEVNFNDPITCFTKIAGTEGKKRLYVDSGTYDILASLGGMDYVNSKSTDTDTWYSVQPVMQDVEIIGKGSVIFNFNLEATHYTHYWLFSCLNVKGDVSVDNVEINASNCRYAIHDEDGSTILKAKKKYCNVRVYKNGIGGQTYGSGYGSKAAVNFINCSFVNSGEQCAWSCHGHTSPRVVFSNCIFENESYSTTDYSVRLSQISQNSLYVVMNNCFVGGKLRLKSEDGGQTNSRTKVDLLNTAAVLENDYTTASYPVTSYNTIAGTKTVLFGS